MCECDWWESLKIDDKIKNHVRTHFTFKRLLSTDSLQAKTKRRTSFWLRSLGFSCSRWTEIKICEISSNFQKYWTWKKWYWRLHEKLCLWKRNAKTSSKNADIYFQAGKWNSYNYSVQLFFGTWLAVYQNLPFCSTYSSKTYSSNFVQSVVDARKEGDEKSLSGVVAETMKLLGNSSYGYQIMDRFSHTITKYLNDEKKTHKAINEPLFKRLKRVEKDLYQVELLKSTIEHRELIIVGFFILQYAKLRMLEIYYNFFDKFCDVNKFEELEMDTDSLYLALAEEILHEFYTKKVTCGKKWGKMTAETLSKQMQNLISSLERVAVSIKRMICESRGFSKKNLGAQKCYVCVAKLIVAMITSQKSSNRAVKIWTNEF